MVVLPSRRRLEGAVLANELIDGVFTRYRKHYESKRLSPDSCCIFVEPCFGGSAFCPGGSSWRTVQPLLVGFDVVVSCISPCTLIFGWLLFYGRDNINL